MTSSCLSQFREWKIPILVGVWKIRSFKEIQWSHKLHVQATTSLGHIKFILFFLSSHIFSPFFSSMEWGALGDLFIYLIDILLLQYFVLLCKLSVFKFYKYIRSKGQDISCIIVQYRENSAISQYLIVNSCNLDGIEYMCESLIIYEWMNYN